MLQRLPETHSHAKTLHDHLPLPNGKTVGTERNLLGVLARAASL